MFITGSIILILAIAYGSVQITLKSKDDTSVVKTYEINDHHNYGNFECSFYMNSLYEKSIISVEKKESIDEKETICSKCLNIIQSETMFRDEIRKCLPFVLNKKKGICAYVTKNENNKQLFLCAKDSNTKNVYLVFDFMNIDKLVFLFTRNVRLLILNQIDNDRYLSSSFDDYKFLDKKNYTVEFVEDTKICLGDESHSISSQI